MKPRNHLFSTVFVPENLGPGVTERPQLYRGGPERVNMILPLGKKRNGPLAHTQRIKSQVGRQCIMILENVQRIHLFSYDKCLISLIEEKKIRCSL